MNRFTLFGSLLLLAAFGLLWLLYAEQPDEDVVSQDRKSYSPDYLASVLHSIQYGENGLPESKVWAEGMRHFEDLGITEFSNPILLVYPRNGDPAWQITAQEGLLRGTDFATLQQNVVISSQSDENQLNTVHTSYLEIDMQEQFLHTDRPVRLVGPNYILNGVGLRAHAESEQIDILDQIQAVYEPN